MRLPSFFAFFVAGALLFGCPKSPPPPSADAAASASGSSSAASAGGRDASDRAEDDDVRPVYPLEGVEPVPVATKLCEALDDLPQKRRAACCSEPLGVVVTKECVRMLSAAIRGGAVDVDEGAVQRCAAAMDKAHDGCDWVGPFPAELPSECLGIVKGKLPARARCRSSLECAGDLRCHGVGPTTPGSCGPARAEGGACGSTTDTLATFVRQDDVDTTHPECKGFCSRIKCAEPGADGSPCSLSRECAAGLQCLGVSKNAPLGTKTGKCSPRAPDKLGQPCPGLVCEKGAQCIAGTCAARKAAGAACTNDFECVGGCVKPDGGAKGQCGKRCGPR